jgi:hypothetical protein
MKQEIIIMLKFDSLEEFHEFENKIMNANVEPVKKVENRGSKTKLLHAKTKEYHELHEDLTYKECLKIVGNNIKNKN